MHAQPKPESNSLIVMNACDKEKQASKLLALSSKHVENEKVGCFKHASRHTDKYPLHAPSKQLWTPATILNYEKIKALPVFG